MGGFAAVDLRSSNAFTPKEIRDAGYLLSQVAPKVEFSVQRARGEAA